MTLLQLHLMIVCVWLGMVLTETVLEFSARDAPARRAVAVAHHWIDVLLEIPILIALVATGALLLARAWPAPPLLLFKVAAGLVAVGANVICFPLVHRRWQARDDARASVLTRQIKLTITAFPFAVAAMVIGLGY